MINSDNQLLKDEKIIAVIRAKDEQVEHARGDLQIEIEYLSDESPQFVSVEAEPLTCGKADKDWVLQMPKVLYHEIQDTSIDLISEQDYFIYDKELDLVKIKDS